MMKQVLPYPLLTASLILMWLVMNDFTVGHLVLGTFIALFASLFMRALEPDKPRLRRWWKLPWLVLIVAIDIAKSNFQVIRIIVSGRRRDINPGFVTIPLELKDRTGLAILACIITTTPGTAWLEYRSHRDTVMIHVLDLENDEAWIELIKTRYERLLREIFE